ncbi:MAG: hypothetical protein AAGI03_09520 [Pseudomonadota bacterium]
MPETFNVPCEKVAVALMAADVHYRMDSNYHSALKRIVFRRENLSVNVDRKDQITFENKLATNAARNALTYIWRTSDEVTEEALAKSGYQKKATRERLTSRGLSKAFCFIGGVTDLDTLTRIEQDIARIVKAAHGYGLIEYDPNPPNKNSKPFHGTNLLHHLMTEVHLGNAKLINGLSKTAVGISAARGGA